MAAWLGGPVLASAEPGVASAEPEAASAAPEAAPDDDAAAIADALSVDPGATCLEHDRLSEQVVTWLGRDALDPRLTVVVEGDPTEVRTLRFTLRDRGVVIAERAFDPGPSSCDDLHAVVALAIALAVDATVLESVGIGATAVPSPPPAPSEPPPTFEPDPAPEPAAALVQPLLDLDPPPVPAWGLRLDARGLLGINTPPTVAGGAMVGLDASWRERVDLHLGAMATTAAPRSIGGGTLAVTLLAARLDVCGGPQLGRVRPRGCLGTRAGNAMAQGRGFEQNGRAVLPWLAMAARGDVRVTLHRRVALGLGLEGLVNVVQPVFYTLQGAQEPMPRFGALLHGGVVIAIGKPFDEGR
ncbi:hypothetical protein [Paraliomyxa miuraensis]|uniref:hypothetical protein n=1 Tax=Paraliomyxa miuraensis TaxID=376150 RepID=UPI00225B5FBB|nr:hypothetical protein [Paraliomyxa miuraensis]MCX4242667.1 hypothetical protein [Paraliomyxa miuraensis]